MNNDLVYEAMPVVIEDNQNEMMGMDFNSIVEMAERADKMVSSLDKIMKAAIKITSPRDWVLIGDTPYLQESGAAKVARLFGISWRILEQKPEYDKDGYPTFYYRMEFRMGNSTIEAEGRRSGKDDFFASAGKGKKKSPDEIDMGDVRMSAFTNCINRGIKSILPGLRNVDIETLESNGINVKKGYTFKEGSKGGKTKEETNEGLSCSRCNTAITQAEAAYSENKYSARLCRACQKLASEGRLNDADSGSNQ